jgi:TolB-like protein/Flp pilus assembly protein TadD
MRRFIAELRRRNVIRIAVAYALSAWILIEAGSVLLPTFGASDEWFRAYVLVVIAGFVVAVVLAWLFQWTPEGVRLDRDLPRDAVPAAPAAPGRFNYAIIALLVAALGVSITFNVVDLRHERKTAPRSIAVLPLDSLSNDEEHSAFADGIHDDLLTRLASIRSLKVISRTSVMEYRDTSKNALEIGEELGVETILEGSVQRAGDNVRVNLQLIDAATDEHLWADTYYRVLTLENIFSIQREISEAVAAALQTTLSPEERARVEATPTTDLRAYRLYKEGRHNLYLRRVDSLKRAREQFAEAVALDPDFAEAHAALAESTVLLWNNHAALPQQEAVAAAERSLARALELDPQLADAYAIRGMLNAQVWQNERTGGLNLAAEAAFRRAIQLNPNHANAHMWFASLRDQEERLDEAIQLYQRAMELDPLGRIPYVNLPLIYTKRGEHDAAMRLWLEAVRVHNDWPIPYSYIGNHLWGMGRLDEAYAWHRQALEQSGAPPDSGTALVGLLSDLGELDKAEAELDEIPPDHPFAPTVEGFRSLLRSDYADAQRRFAALIENPIVPHRVACMLASDSALLAGDFRAARRFALEADPLLAADAGTVVDRQTLHNAVKLAYIDMREGREREASGLLHDALALIRRFPRLGTYGYGIRDVQIYALLGRKEDALQAFREALDAGFRGSVFFDGWPVPLDPYLASLRDEPRFVAMTEELEQHLEDMRERVAAAEANGDLAALRARAALLADTTRDP